MCEVHNQASETITQPTLLSLCVSHFILNELSKGRFVGAVLIDLIYFIILCSLDQGYNNIDKNTIRSRLKKAFDTVDHNILLKKLFCYGFRETSLDWIQSYPVTENHVNASSLA